MKQILFLTAFIFLFQTGIQAGRDKPITFDELPAKSKELINTHFADVQIAFTKEEVEIFDKSYEVIFVNGNTIEFDKKGDWKEIDCKYTEVPDALVPSAILKYVRDTYSGVRIKSIEKRKKGYEVDLANGIELEFDKAFNLTDIDN